MTPESVTAQTSRYGSAALDALVAAVRRAKDGDPLATVTVVVPGERLGVAVRRALARSGTNGRPGIAALSVLPLRRLAETLVGDQLAAGGRRPLTTSVLAAAVRGVLHDSPGLFAPVAGHIGTVRALARAHRELRTLPRAALAELEAQGGVVVGETARVHRELTGRCAAGTFDEVDLLRAASRTVAGQAPVELGAVIVFLPQDLDAAERELLASLATRVPLHVIVGFTGDPHADAGPLASVRGIGVDVASDATEVPGAAEVVHASDSDDEVRGVVRRVVTDLTHCPGHRIAVLYGSADPYARLLHEHLARAGVQTFGRGVRTAAEGRTGRGLLRMFALTDHDFRRDEVLAWITDAPVRHGGAPAPGSAWERVSRAAGVVRGGHWTRLEEFARQHEVRAAAARAAAAPELWRAERDERTAADARGLLSFVTDLQDRFARLHAATTWEELGKEAMDLWSGILGVEDVEALPPEERRTSQTITATLTALAGLGEIGGPPGVELLRELLELRLGDELDRVGRIGVGVHVGPVSEGVGDVVDRMYVVGAAEGILPSRSGDDPLLPDRVRTLTGGELPTLAERVRRQHRHLLAALAAAPPGGRVVSFPRGNLRGGGARVPSRWLLPTLRRLSGDPDLQITQWERAAGLTELPSYVGSLAASAALSSAQEWRQRAAADADLTGAALPLDAEPDVAVLAMARKARSERAGPGFTPFDGNLGGERLPDPTGSALVSATALETWVACPHDYFLRHLLRVGPVELPEDVVRISALDRGSVLHDVLDDLVTASLADGWAPRQHEPWPGTARDLLDGFAQARFAKAEQRGVTGFALLWELDRAALLTDLRTWLDHDDARRREFSGLVPVAAEWAFGSGDTAPAEVPLDDGRTLRLRGKIDRVDRAPDGALVVTDYKSGKSDRYRTLTAADPCSGGRRLQLPIYALAARAAFGTPTTPVHSAYWFTSHLGRFARIGYDVDDDVIARATAALRAVVDGITLGLFPQRPGENGAAGYGTTRTSGFRCQACDPDGLGEATGPEEWDRIGASVELTAPGLAQAHALLFGEAT